jgi:hypothetical protein
MMYTAWLGQGCATAAAVVVKAPANASARNANLNDSRLRETYQLGVGRPVVSFLQDSMRFELTCIKCDPLG